MNVVDIVIIGIIAVTVISGMYRGFISSLLSTANFFIAWAASYAIYPHITSALLGREGVLDTLYYYSDAASRLGTGVARTQIALAGESLLQSALEAISLPEPFGELLRNNLNSQVFAGMGLSTIGDYVNQTIVTVVLSVVCFLVVFGACFLVLNLLVSLLNYVFKFPALKHFDALTGGALGFVRGYFLVFLLFTLVPILLTALPVEAISEYINASMLGAHFLESNFITSIIEAAL